MNILLVEDERDIAEPLLDLLQAHRYNVRWAASLETAYHSLGEKDFDLAVLDVMLPESENGGFELAQSLRDTGFEGSILFLTARDSIEDRAKGLDLGGDDYLVKPFSLKEFIARVRALLRRTAQAKNTTFERGALKVNFKRRQVCWQEKEVRLSDREFAMLELFAHYPDKVFSAEDLLDRFFPDAESGKRVVRVYINQLRQKLDVSLINTISGGYTLGV